MDNDGDDEYCYQMLVFTGQRRDAATKSKVCSIDPWKGERVYLIADLLRVVG